MSEARVAPTETAAVRLARPEVRGFSIIHRRGPWRDALRRRMLAGADLASVATALSIAIAAEPAISPAWIAIAPLWLVLAKLYGLYDGDHRALRHLTADDFPELVAWATTSTGMTAALVATVRGPDVSVDWAITLFLTTLVLAPAARAAARGLWRRIVPPEHALIVGSGALERATRRKLELFSDIHVRCVGSLSEDAAGTPGGLAGGVAATEDLDRVIIASGTIDEALIAEHVEICRARGLKLSIVPPARGMFGTAAQLNRVADLPLIEYSTWDTGQSTLLVKRSLDVAGAAAGLILLAPLVAVVALAIRLTSPGPALFVQQRAGRDGRPFRMYKFRTMRVDAEKHLLDVVDIASLADPMFKLRDDTRTTRLGRWLRRSSLDELPQLVNVIRGEMSLVGPRPEQVDLVARYSPEHRIRLSVKPGITGPMQVYGRGELRFDERLAVEREYVENVSVRRDLRILVLTIAAVTRGKGAF
jgi:exopolysaccharide biosynthesis polyprenyl glycosylphosphotransferase